MVKQNWRYLLFLIVSHHPQEKLHRTIRIGFRRKYVYLCSRCTGTIFGMTAIFAANAFGLRFPLEAYLPLISLLPLVAAIDWFTQSAKLRESKNWLRISSGFLLGSSEALFLLLVIDGFLLKSLIALGIASIYALSIYLIAAKTKCLDSYLNEINQI
ncbi:DUF2085 domain-containing protein [Candidatus Bathyarchaeota archaeon]|nr:DUF2085 domain-containing protein [Candidatus Bathyarchaeota archaeon]